MDDVQWQEDYEAVRDAVVAYLDPQDDDVAEPEIMVRAIKAAASELAQMREALRPFAEAAKNYGAGYNDDDTDDPEFSVGDFRRAAAVLALEPE